MKYAYIIGSNAFVVPGNTISYRDHGENKEFLKINSFNKEHPAKNEREPLICDVNLTDADGTQVNLVANQLVNAHGYTISATYDSLEIKRPDNSVLLHVHQMDWDTAMSLEHNIVAELEVNTPVVPIRIYGDFMLGGLHIKAENEKLFINDEGWGNSVQAGAHQLSFAEEGVVLF